MVKGIVSAKGALFVHLSLFNNIINFSNYYSLKMKYVDNIHALATWFDCTFGNLTRPVVLTTSPMKKYTHWK